MRWRAPSGTVTNMELRRVDPTRPHGPLTKAWHAVGRSPVGRWYGIEVASRLDAALLRHTGGGLRLVGPLPTAVLTTTGARTGQRRDNPVLYFHDGDDVVLVASSFGREHSPGWAHNARHNPAVALNGIPFQAAEVRDPADYERLYALATKVYAGFADYRHRAEAAGRHIPILRLSARS